MCILILLRTRRIDGRRKKTRRFDILIAPLSV
jgi:hypothetical protein